MPRREKDRELARRRKRKRERRKLHAKGLLTPTGPKGAGKEAGKKPEKAVSKESPKTTGESSTGA